MLRLVRTAVLAAFALFAPALVSAQTVLVKPYVQPGAGGNDRSDTKVICWFTDQKPGEFVVEYSVPGQPPAALKPERVALDFDKKTDPNKPDTGPKTESKDDPPEKTGDLPPEREQRLFKYVARLTELPLDAEVRYRVKLGATVVREASFRTRASAAKPVRLALVGDLANGHLRMLNRQTMEEIPGSAFGQTGHGAGQFNGLHALATASKGNVYVAETRGARLQKSMAKGGK